MRALHLVPALILLALATPASAQTGDNTTPGKDPTPALLIQGGTLHAGPGQEASPADVTVRDGRIIEVGEPGSLGLPSGGVEIDASGLHLYPGFIDAHQSGGLSDTATSDEELEASAGSEPNLGRLASARMALAIRKGIRPHLLAAEHLDLSDGKLRDLHKLGLTAAVFAPSNELLGGAGALVALSGLPRRESVLNDRVALFGGFSSYGSSYPGTVMGTLAHMRQTLLDAGWHLELKQRATAGKPGPRPAWDPALDALAPLLSGDRRLVIRANSENAIHRALDLADEFGLSLVISGGEEAWRVVDRLSAAKVPVILDLELPKEPKQKADEKKSSEEKDKPKAEIEPAPPSLPRSPRKKLARRGASGPKDKPEDKPEAGSETTPPSLPPPPHKVLLERHQRWQERLRCARVLHEAGVPLCFSLRGLSDADDVYGTLAKLIDDGLPPEATLEALTTTPARLVGAGRELGRVEAGRAAHLTLLTKPLGDEKARVHSVVVEGRHVEVNPKGSKKKQSKGPGFDLSGTWAFQATTDMGEVEGIMILEQKGSQITGDLDLPIGKGKIVNGEIDGAEVTLQLRSEIDGQPMVVNMQGSLEGDELTGTASSDTLAGAIEWHARREGGPPPALAQAPKKDKDEPGKQAPNKDEQPPSVAGKDKSEAKDPSAITRLTDDDAEVEADRRPLIRTGGDVLVRGASVISLGSAGTLDRGTILIRDGRIVAVGPEASLREQARGAPTVVEAAGHWITPGIIDCHSHIAASGGLNEGSRAITPEVRIGDVIDHRSVSIYRALAGGVTTINVLHGSANPIGGQNAVLKLRYGEPARALFFEGAPRGVKFALGENPKRSNWRSSTARFPNSRAGVEAVYRRAFNEARDYARRRAAVAAARERGEDPAPLRRDLRLEALADILQRKILVHCHCYRADEILMMVGLARDHGFRLATLQHALEAYKVAPEVAAGGVGVSTFADWWAFKFEAYDAIPHNSALCTRAGAVVSINSDSAEAIRHLWLEAAKVVKHGGLSEEEALKLITLNPAIQLGIEDRVGSLEPGKDGDLAIFDGHPLSGSARCVMTLVDGEVRFADPRRVRVVDGNVAWLQRPGREADAPPTPSPLAGLDRKPGSPLPQAPPSDRPAYALVGGHIHTMAGADFPDGTLVIRGDEIVAVGSRSMVDVPNDAHVVDVRGRHVWPGLIDAGTSMGLSEIDSVAGSVDARSSSGFQADLRALVAVNPHSEHIPVARVNGVTTVLTAPGGGPIAGQSALIRLAGWTPQQMAVSPTAALHISLPSAPRAPRNPSKEARKRNKEALKAFSRGLKELREVLAAARRLDDTTTDDGSLRDPRLVALLPYLRGEAPVIIGANRVADIAAAIEFSQKEKLKLIVSGGREAWKCAELLAHHDVPVLLGPTLSMPLESHDRFDAPFIGAARLEEAGVRFCFRSDSTSNSRNLPYHAAAAVAFGLDRETAWRALTMDAAEILGVSDRIGSLEAGKDADVVVSTGDILEPVTEVTTLFIGGQPMDLETRHTRLHDRFEQRLPARPAASGKR